MALMCRRKALCVISRYRSCGRSSSSSTGGSSPARPAMAMHSSLAAPPSSAFFATRNYTVPAFVEGKCMTKDAPCCFSHKCTSRCGCSCTGLLFSARNCTTTAYPPPTPPGEFEGGDEEGEADGAPLNVNEASGEDTFAPEGMEDFDMPPYNANDAEDDGDYVDEDPPPDPEEALLFSPSDSD